MKAKQARRLRVGDRVSVYFSNAKKTATIAAIDWPHFIVVAEAANGYVLTRKARYESLERLPE